jgi:hypothetical protein
MSMSPAVKYTDFCFLSYEQQLREVGIFSLGKQ